MNNLSPISRLHEKIHILKKIILQRIRESARELKVIFRSKREDEEIFLVSGKGCIIFNLDFKPDFFEVDFLHKHEHLPCYPSCNPVKHDHVTIELVHIKCFYGVKICWEVNESREVKWFAKRL